MIPCLVLKLWEIPDYIELRDRSGAKKFYRVAKSKNQLGIALNSVDPEVEKQLRRESRGAK